MFCGTKKNELVFGEVFSQIKNKCSTVGIRINSDSNVVFFFLSLSLSPRAKTKNLIIL
jgi:hypothetical protein